MSFLNNARPERTPGIINGNPLNGLNERACLQVKKVFDACIMQESMENVSVTATNITPTPATGTYTFVSMKSSSNQGVISNLVVTPLDDQGRCSRVSCTITCPVTIVFTDSAGTTCSGDASLVITQDVILHIPNPSIIPYQIEAVVNVVCPIGTWVSGDTFSVTACVTSIIKVVMEVELLVPTYGYAYIPPCQEYKEEICDGFFDLPLFPNDCPIRR